MAMVMWAGILEILMVAGLAGGIGLPMGLPPAEEDPVMSRVLPDNVLAYISIAGMAKPDPNSENRAERLFADKEINALVEKIWNGAFKELENELKNERLGITADDVKLMVRSFLTKPITVYMSEFQFDPSFNRPPAIVGGLVINLGDDALQIATILNRLEAIAGIPPLAPGQRWHEIPTDERDFDSPIHWNVFGKYLVLGIGTGEGDAILARSKTAAPQWVADIKKRVDIDRLGSIVYLDIESFLHRFTSEPEFKLIFDRSKGDWPKQLITGTGLGNDGILTRTILQMGDTATESLSQTPTLLTLDAMKEIPADAVAALALHIHPIEANEKFRNWITKSIPMGGEIYDELFREIYREFDLDELEDELGVSLSDILKPLGPNFRLYSATSDGGPLGTGVTLVADVKDSAAMTAVNEKFIAGIKQHEREPREDGTRRRGVYVETFKHEGETVYMMNILEEEVPVTPCWCITEDRVAITLAPQYMKAYLNRKAGKATTGSLADQPKVAATFEQGNRNAALLWGDMKQVTKVGYAPLLIGVKSLLDMMHSEGIMENLTIADIPSAAALLPYMDGMTITAGVGPKGEIIIESNQPIPNVLPAGLPMMFFGMVSYRMNVMEVKQAEIRAIAQ